MAIKWISTGWEDDLKARVSPTERIYIDFTQQIYPPITGNLMRVGIIEGILVGDLASSTNPGTAT